MVHESSSQLFDRRPATPAPRSVLVCSGDPHSRSRLRLTLEQQRWTVRETAGAAEAIIEVERLVPEVLVLDTWLPDLEIGEFVTLLHSLHPALEVLRMDGVCLSKGSRSQRRQELVACLRELEPGQPDPAHVQITRSQRRPDGSPRAPGHPIPDDARASSALAALVGSSPALTQLVDLVRLVAPCDTTVLIEGETGTGKELVAQAIHACSNRSGRSLVVLNCAAIPESLLEAELFGHARGAFTGAVQARIGRIEAADGGTLFLDEIGEMPLALQAKMLRFLECGELQRVGENTISRVDVRVIAATHQPLEQRAEEGAFRLDLYHRLAVFPIDVPPLRDRIEDLPALIEHILERLSDRVPGVDSNQKRLSGDALSELKAHRWPGNVRELKHVLERAVILSGNSVTLERDHIRIRRRPRPDPFPITS